MSKKQKTEADLAASLQEHEAGFRSIISEARYRTLFQTMAQGAVYIDAAGRITDMNPAAERILGVPLSQMQGKSWADWEYPVVHEDGSEFPGDLFPGVNALQTGEPVQGVVMGIHNPQQNKCRWIEVHTLPLLGPEGDEEARVFITFDDITERKCAHDIVQRLATIVESSDDAILSQTLDGTIQTWNKGAERLYGYTESEMIGRNVNTLVPENAPNDIPELLDRIRHGEVIDRYDAVRQSRDGKVLTVSLSVSPLRNTSGTAIGASMIARDVTEPRAARERIEHLNRVLRAIRDVNQLIVREGTPGELIRQACDILVSTQSFRAVWIALMDEDLGMTSSAQAGIEETSAAKLFSVLAAGMLPACCQRARIAGKTIVIPAPGENCSTCPVRDVHAGTVAFTACLQYQGKIYGYLTVYAESCPGAEAEELSLLVEIAGDLAFALHGIESEKNRKAAELAVRRERDFTKNLVDTAQAIVLVLDPEGRIVRFNPYMEELCGIPLSEVQDKDWCETFLPKYDRDRIRVLFLTAVGGTRTLGNVNAILTRDGGKRLVEWYDSTLKDEDGRVTGLLAIGHDVTDKIAAEQAREEANVRLAAAVKAADVGLWDYYPQENRAHFSAEWKRQLGYEPHEVGDSADEWSGRLHGEDRDRALRILSDYLEGGTQGEYTAEFRLRHKDGSYRWILSQGAAVEFEAGVITRMLGCHIDITESKRIEEQLRQSEKRLSEAQTIAHVGSWELNLITNELVWSEENYRIFELDPADAPPDYERFLQCVHPDDRARVDKVYTESITSHTAYTVEHRLLLPDGRVKYVIECCETFYDEAGNPLRSVGTTQDITDRRLAEETLRRNEELLKETGDLARVGAWEIDLATDTVFWTHATRVIHEVPDDYVPTLEEAINFFAPEARKGLAEVIRRARQEGIPYDLELPFVTAKGRKLWTHVIGKPEFRDGKCVRMHGTFQDITEHKLAEDALRVSEERFRRTIMAAPFPAMVHAEDGEVLLINDVWEELSGYTRNEIPTVETWTERAYGERCGQIGAAIDSLYKQGSRVEEGEFTICCKNGSTRIWAFASAPLGLDASGRRLVLSMAKDVTENRAMLDRVRQSEKLEAIGQLAGGVAHDFNNLLMGIMNYVELCRDGIEPDHPIREWLDEITADAQRSANLTRQLLAFARKQTIVPRIVDLNDDVAGMLKMLRRLIGEDIDLVWEPGANLWLVRIDPSQVDQILANLCVNARDAIGGVGKITIETDNAELDANYCSTHVDAVPGAYVMLAVSDTGHGMEREILERIFEPFFTTKGIGQGTGLGLATVHGIVRQNEGHISVYSEPGQGTTFRIYFPRFAGTTADMGRTEGDNALRGGNETILLVEDERSIRVTAASFLQSFGYTVLVAETPGEALNLVSKYTDRIHLLVSDVVMPGMSGRDLAERLIKKYPDLKCLYMSGYTANAIAHRGVLDKDVNFLSKPFSRDVLIRKVREVLESRTCSH